MRSFQLAQLVYDITVRFCDRYIDRSSRTKDQMVQAARSGVQNIAEGSAASGTSKKFELDRLLQNENFFKFKAENKFDHRRTRGIPRIKFIFPT